MKLEKALAACLFLLMMVACFEVSAQNPKPPERINLLNNFGSIPFEDGKTIIDEIIFDVLDKDEVAAEIESVSEFEKIKIPIDRKSSFTDGEKFSGFMVVKTVNSIREFLLEKGFFQNEVEALGQETGKNGMRIIFTIKHGPLARVSQIFFEGNKNVLSDELTENFKDCFGGGWRIFSSSKYEYRNERCTLSLFHRKGFLRARVGKPQPVLSGGGYLVTIPVEEGARFRFGEIKVKGASVFSETEIVEMSGWKKGNIVDAGDLQDFVITRLKNNYAERGYVLYDADFNPIFIEPTAEEIDGTLNMELIIEEGRQFKLARVEFLGVEKEKSNELRRLFNLSDGEIYCESKVLEGLRKLNELQEFYPLERANSRFEIETDEENSELVLRISLQKIEK